jgi:hypothetical protein
MFCHNLLLPLLLLLPPMLRRARALTTATAATAATAISSKCRLVNRHHAIPALFFPSSCSLFSRVAPFSATSCRDPFLLFLFLHLRWSFMNCAMTLSAIYLVSFSVAVALLGLCALTPLPSFTSSLPQNPHLLGRAHAGNLSLSDRNHQNTRARA